METRPSSDLNERIYDRRWSAARKIVQFRPHLWRDVGPSLRGERLLEIGPGLRPTIPLEGSYFIDVSQSALDALAKRGGRVSSTAPGPLPFEDGYFGGVFAFEVLEHVDNDAALVAEIARVLRPDGTFVLSVPLRMSHWSRLDEISAHVRRYEPEDLLRLLDENGFDVEAYVCTKERARPRLARVGASIFEATPRISDVILQSVFFPLLAARQRRLPGVRWAAPETPIPKEATGITVRARRATRDVSFNRAAKTGP